MLLRYTSALKPVDYVHFCQEGNYYNAWMISRSRGFFEAFFAVPAGDYAELSATVERDQQATS